MLVRGPASPSAWSRKSSRTSPGRQRSQPAARAGRGARAVNTVHPSRSRASSGSIRAAGTRAPPRTVGRRCRPSTRVRRGSRGARGRRPRPGAGHWSHRATAARSPGGRRRNPRAPHRSRRATCRRPNGSPGVRADRARDVRRRHRRAESLKAAAAGASASATPRPRARRARHVDGRCVQSTRKAQWSKVIAARADASGKRRTDRAE